VAAHEILMPVGDYVEDVEVMVTVITSLIGDLLKC